MPFTKIQLRRDTSTNWSSNNPVLESGEIGIDTTNKVLKIGDGTTAWNSLDVGITGTGTQTLTNKTLTTPTFSSIGGDEGGEVWFGIPATNTTLNTRITVDSYQDRFRIFEGGGTGKGVFIDLASASAGAGSELITNDKAQTLTNKTLTLPSINNPRYGYTTTATAAETTTLTASSNYMQFFTGTTTQTIVLPDVTTLVLGQSYYIENVSTGNLTVNSSGGNLVATVIPEATVLFTCILTSGTTAASWDADWHGFSTITGTGANVLGTAPTINNLVLTGTVNAGGGNGTNGQVLQSTGTGVQWGTVSGYSAPTLGTTSIGSGSTVTTINGLTLTASNMRLQINAQTGTSYNLVANDANNTWVTCNNAAAITVNVPANVFSVGDTINVQQIGAGQVTFAQSGTTITSTGATASAPKLRTQYASATIICVASNTFTIVGDIS